MAVSKVDVRIQNPAGKRSNMTAKQIKYFGSKRQKAALKAKRKKARHSSAKKHRPRAKKHNAAPRKKSSSTHRHTKAKARKKKTSHRSRTVKRNLGSELVAFVSGNPARKRSKSVATSKKRQKSSAASRSAGSRRSKGHHHSKKRKGNPAGIPLKDFMWGGIGGLGGFVGSAAIPQLVLGAGNTGVVGYGVTAAAGIGLAILAHMFVKNRAVTFGVGIGAAMNLLRRVISDQTPFGPYLSNPGMGDYMVANWGPPLMTDGLRSAIAAPYGTAVTATNGVSMSDYADIGGGHVGRPC